jgi:GntR family transcriptional regulator/MocR family aminotransferase
VRAVYCTPAHQYPLGGRLTAGRRIAIADWARANNGWVIEDDYDGELRYDVAPLPLLAALGSDVVVHLGTSSKIISPSLGAGWLVGPPRIIDAVMAHRDRAGVSPSPAGQRVFTAMATSGDLSRHLRRVRKELAERRDMVTSVFVAAGIRVWGDDAGAHVVIPMADLDRERHVVKAAEAEGILVEGVERCFNGEPTLAGIILGYAAPPHRSVLTEAVSRLLPILPRP